MKTVKYWLPPLLWMGIIFYFSARQRISVSPDFTLNFLFFKSLHLIEYFVLYVLLFRAVRSGRSIPSDSVFTVSMIFLLVYAASDEIHQSLVPTREARFRDVIIDGIGGILAWLSLVFIIPNLPAKLRHWAGRLEIAV